MYRQIFRLDESHDQTTFKFESTSERDAWLRTFPNPLPSTHRLVFEWTDAMTLVVRVEAKCAPAGVGLPAAVEAVGVVDAGGTEVAGATTEIGAAGVPAAEPTEAEIARMGELTGKKHEDLDTLAGELGITGSAEAAKGWGRLTKAQKAALILEAEGGAGR